MSIWSPFKQWSFGVDVYCAESTTHKNQPETNPQMYDIQVYHLWRLQLSTSFVRKTTCNISARLYFQSISCWFILDKRHLNTSIPNFCWPSLGVFPAELHLRIHHDFFGPGWPAGKPPACFRRDMVCPNILDLARRKSQLFEFNFSFIPNQVYYPKIIHPSIHSSRLISLNNPKSHVASIRVKFLPVKWTTCAKISFP